ncbi:MAG TPA: hypothetical protein VGM93_06275, partial [Acidimicrobiales bacterium]
LTVASVLGRHWIAGGDQAVEIMRMRDVGTAHTPLTGAYSRFGWQHPGPLLFWVGAPGARFWADTGVLVTVGLVNAASIAAAVRAAGRVGGRSLAVLVAAGALWMCHTMALATLLDPWNPWVGVMPLLAFLVCAWAAAEGDRWSLLVAVATASYAVQSHVGSAPLVALATVGSVTWWLLRRRWISDDDRPTIPWPWVAGAGALFLLLWSLPLYQQLTGRPGNLAALVRFFRSNHEVRSSTHDVLGAAARELGLHAAWLGASEDDHVGFLAVGAIWTLAVSGLALVGATAVSAVRRDRSATALATWFVVLFGGSIVAMSRTTGGFFPYVVRWTWPVAMTGWAVVAWCAWRAVAHGRMRLAADRALPLAATAVALLSVAVVASAWPVASPQQADNRALGRLDAQLRHALRPGRYDISWRDPRAFGTVGIGVGVDLRQRGYDVAFAAGADEFGNWRVTAFDSQRPLLMVVSSLATGQWSPSAGDRLVASYDPLDRARRREAGHLEQRIRAAAGVTPADVVDARSPFERATLQAHGAQRADITALARLQQAGDAYRIWLVRP